MTYKFGQVSFALLIAGGLFFSACSPAPIIETEIENTPEPEPTATLVVSTEKEEIINEPTPPLDVSEWMVTVGGYLFGAALAADWANNNNRARFIR